MSAPRSEIGVTLARVLVAASALGATACAPTPTPPRPATTADTRIAAAVGWLVAEVPRWVEENDCFSCHNDGDGARTLWFAERAGYAAKTERLARTLDWLGRPEDWRDNRGDPSFADHELARWQFFVAAAEGRVDDAARRAAAAVVAAQADDGAFAVEPRDAIGGPTTWGTPWATAQVVAALERVDGFRFASAIGRARAWLASLTDRTVLDAASVLVAGAGDASRRSTAATWLVRAQNDDGGWGSHPRTPSEVFDTAVALLALVHDSAPASATERGRNWLRAAQLDDGSWVETTRPDGGVSYAQRVSTSAWATRALIATRP